jgi:hypothetical protein
MSGTKYEVPYYPKDGSIFQTFKLATYSLGWRMVDSIPCWVLLTDGWEDIDPAWIETELLKIT